MNIELGLLPDQKDHDWGSSEFSHFLVENFDRIARISGFDEKQTETKIYTRLLLPPLISRGKIDETESEDIQFLITHRKTDDEDAIPEDPKLLKVRCALIEEFGHEVVRRLNISTLEVPEI